MCLKAAILGVACLSAAMGAKNREDKWHRHVPRKVSAKTALSPVTEEVVGWDGKTAKDHEPSDTDTDTDVFDELNGLNAPGRYDNEMSVSNSDSDKQRPASQSQPAKGGALKLPKEAEPVLHIPREQLSDTIEEVSSPGEEHGGTSGSESSSDPEPSSTCYTVTLEDEEPSVISVSIIPVTQLTGHNKEMERLVRSEDLEKLRNKMLAENELKAKLFARRALQRRRVRWTAPNYHDKSWYITYNPLGEFYVSTKNGTEPKEIDDIRIDFRIHTTKTEVTPYTDVTFHYTDGKTVTLPNGEVKQEISVRGAALKDLWSTISPKLGRVVDGELRYTNTISPKTVRR